MIEAADVVVPITGPPITQGGVLVDGDLIADVGPLDQVMARHPDVAVRHWPGVMTPGLVNAHTHLQYTTFDRVGAVRYPDYVSWAVRFVAEYDARPHEDWVAAARLGVERSLAAGVTCLADVVTDWEARDVLIDAALPGIAYLELIGTDPADWEGAAATDLEDAISSAPVTDWSRVGISPHAPYSVDERVIVNLVEMARRLGVRLHVHLAEIDSEEELYRSGTGVWAERVRQVARRRLTLADRGGAGLGTAEFAASLGLLTAQCHIAHGIYLDGAGRAMLAASGTVPALCPRSNLSLGQSPPPIADYLRERVPFAIGTDSLGSTQSLDPMDDVAVLRTLAADAGYDHPDLGRRLLEAATLGGARAMGLDGLLGSLEAGKRADLAIFDVEAQAADVEGALTGTGGSHCLATIVGGVVRWEPRTR
ncbi:MAG: amidohydrolase family protein [Acidimicrobiia bacterium]